VSSGVGRVASNETTTREINEGIEQAHTDEEGSTGEGEHGGVLLVNEESLTGSLTEIDSVSPSRFPPGRPAAAGAYGRIRAWSQSKNRCRTAVALRSKSGTIGSERGISFLKLT
jgi:hypothetical protein